MPRKYSHIQEHEKEGMTLRQIGEKLGFTYKRKGSVKDFSQNGLQTLV